MVKALKALQSIMLNQGKTNAKLTLALEDAKKDKGADLSKEATKAMKTSTPKSFTRKDIKAEKMKQWAFRMEAYFESQMINIHVDKFRMAQSFLRDHALEWWMVHKDVELNDDLALECI
jgi:hypothetical protein